MISPFIIIFLVHAQLFLSPWLLAADDVWCMICDCFCLLELVFGSGCLLSSCPLSVLFCVCFWWELSHLCSLVVQNGRDDGCVLAHRMIGWLMHVDAWMCEEPYVPDWLKYGR